MENLFLDVMTNEEIGKLERTKQNKAFALRLINDLREVFVVNERIVNQENSVNIEVYAYNKRTPNFIFIANSNGVKITCGSFKGILGYYSVKNPEQNSHIKPLGFIYEKYCQFTSNVEKSFSENKDYGWFNFSIPIVNDSTLKETLRDIIYLLEFEKFNKRI